MFVVRFIFEKALTFAQAHTNTHKHTLHELQKKQETKIKQTNNNNKTNQEEIKPNKKTFHKQ